MKKDFMEGFDARLGCRNKKGNKEGRGTFDESFSCEKAFEGVDKLLGPLEFVTKSVKDS
jgi:hypothetical protein